MAKEKTPAKKARVPKPKYVFHVDPPEAYSGSDKVHATDPSNRKVRVPKPHQSWATSKLIELIPFLNSSPDQPGVMVGHIVHQLEIWSRARSEIIRRWTKDTAVIDGLSETISDIRYLLSNAADEQIKQRIREFLRCLAPTIAVFPSGPWLAVNCYPRDCNREFSIGSAEDLKEFDRIWIPGFRAMLYCLIVEALAPSAYPVVKESNVSFYIGCCPKCGKVFEKDRGDQLYCSKTCGSVARVERSRGAKA